MSAPFVFWHTVSVTTKSQMKEHVHWLKLCKWTTVFRSWSKSRCHEPHFQPLTPLAFISCSMKSGRGKPERFKPSYIEQVNYHQFTFFVKQIMGVVRHPSLIMVECNACVRGYERLWEHLEAMRLLLGTFWGPIVVSRKPDNSLHECPAFLLISVQTYFPCTWSISRLNVGYFPKYSNGEFTPASRPGHPRRDTAFHCVLTIVKLFNQNLIYFALWVYL